MEMNAGCCVVRSWRYADLPSLVENANNPKIWRAVRDQFPSPYTPDAAERWLNFVSLQRPETNFAISVGGKSVGGIGLVIHHDIHRLTAELGYWLGEKFWGAGIMSAAVAAFTGHAFSAYGLVSIYAHVFDWNLASARVLEKSGYTLEARLCKGAYKEGKVIDELLYAAVR